MKKILFYVGVKKRDIFEGEQVEKAGNYVKIKMFKEDGSWSFKWMEKMDYTIVHEFEV